MTVSTKRESKTTRIVILVLVDVTDAVVVVGTRPAIVELELIGVELELVRV